MPFTLTSPAIPPGGEIPREYTCDGADISPPLVWSGVPPGTASLVLVIDDLDAPRGRFGHWGVYDLPPGTPGLPAGFGRSEASRAVRQARNDFGRVG